MVLKYEDIQPTCPAPGITRRILAHGGGMMGVEASFQKGAVGEAHRHPHEQVSYILSGCFEYEVEGQKYILHKGDSYYVAPDLLHGAVALEEGVILEEIAHPPGLGAFIDPQGGVKEDPSACRLPLGILEGNAAGVRSNNACNGF